MRHFFGIIFGAEKDKMTCPEFFSNWLGDTDYKEKTFCEKCKPR